MSNSANNFQPRVSAVIVDADDQSKQAKVNSDGSISTSVVSNARGSNSLNDSELGYMFWGYATCAAVSAKYSAIQIFNPANSGKIVKVFTPSAWNLAAGTVVMNLVRSQSTLSTEVGMLSNLRAGGSASTAKIYKQNLDAVTAAADAGVFSVSSASAPGTSLSSINNFVTLPAGWGLQIEAQTANTGLGMMFSIGEYPA